jgi:uncharacterized membrane protein YfcA
VILPLSIVSAVAYSLRGALPITDALPYLVGGLVGGFIGGRVFKKVPPSILRRAFALLLIVGGVRSVLC